MLAGLAVPGLAGAGVVESEVELVGGVVFNGDGDGVRVELDADAEVGGAGSPLEVGLGVAEGGGQ